MGKKLWIVRGRYVGLDRTGQYIDRGRGRIGTDRGGSLKAWMMRMD